MKFGIPQSSLNMMIKALNEVQSIKAAAIFGSRAMGNYKRGSDIDLVIYGNLVNEKIVNQLSVRLNEELPLPYYFDIVHYETLANSNLKEHIDRFAKSLYLRSETPTDVNRS